MRRARRPFAAPPWLRLLASWLVMLSLVGNGLAVAAPSYPTAAAHDCCAGKHAAAGADCARGGKPCPADAGTCSATCLARAANVPLPMPAAVALAPIATIAPTHPAAHLRNLTEPGPGLRPPISA